MEEMLAKALAIFQAMLEPNRVTIASLPLGVLIFFMMISAALVTEARIWRWTGIITTIYHETGHALAAWLTFSKLRGIRINMNHSGDTQYLTTSFLPFRIFASWWGYPFPAIAGWLYLWAVYEGRVGIALTLTAIVAILISLQARNLLGFLSIVGATALILFAWWQLPAKVLEVPFFLLGWFLIFSGIKALYELTVHHIRSESEGSDALELARMTFILPSPFWLLTFYASAGYALYRACLLVLS